MARPTVIVIIVVVALLAVTCSESAAASTPGSVSYSSPVQGVIVDHFRPPPNPYAAGNRGLDYVTVPGSDVLAAGDGEVIFAGMVAGARHVTIRHADGLRTTYSFLASISVTEGHLVRRGEAVGTTESLFHFGVRAPDDTYLDPELLFGAVSTVTVRLVPGAEEGRRPLAEHERSVLADLVRLEGTRLRAVADALSPDEARILAHYAIVLRPDYRAARMAASLVEWERDRGSCSGSGPIPTLPERHLVVLVGGLGSTSEGAAIDELDTASLGYGSGDVVRFSYRGGRVPSAQPLSQGLADLPQSTYSSIDTQGDLDQAAHRLAELLDQLADAEPGVPIDVVAHSQGGVVARLALDRSASGSEDAPPVATLVTLGSPHEGANLATAVAATSASRHGSSLLEAIHDGLDLDLDPSAPSIAELAETSGLTARLRALPPPDGVHVVSIGARGDLVVPAGRTRLAGAEHTVVPLVGLHAHDRLPSDPRVTREVGLAITGSPPTCESLGGALADAVVADTVAASEDAAGLAGLLGPQLAAP